MGRASETEGKKWRLVKLVLLIWLQRGGRQWLLEKVLLPLSRKLAKLAATRPKPVAVAFAESECTESSKETLTSISNLAAASNASDPETPPVLPATEDVPTESSPSEEPLPPLPTLQPPPKQTPMPTAPSFSLLPTDMPEHPDSKSEKPKPFAFNGFDNGPETPMRKPAKPFIERKARKMDLE